VCLMETTTYVIDFDDMVGKNRLQGLSGTVNPRVVTQNATYFQF
jgi:hypothetical protein